MRKKRHSIPSRMRSSVRGSAKSFPGWSSDRSGRDMLTIEEVRAVPIFSTLGQGELERLVMTSADLHLAAGEFAVPEGGERALFAVLSGKIQVVKTFDGVERTLGWRLPGTIFGE